MQQRNGELFDAALTVAVVRDRQNQLQGLHWLVRVISERRQLESSPFNKECDFSSDRPLHKYCKGETISLNPQVIWYVYQGLVKLSTVCEGGEEIMVGLAKEGMVFSSSMTSLHTYQAIALCDVELVPIYLSEIEASPEMGHALLAKINQRLRQTECFLAISGRRRVEERLHYLLKLLKQEIGQPITEGILLNIRLTHEDIANACCTTRVTITRLMRKLQKQGQISLDAQKHIILRGLE